MTDVLQDKATLTDYFLILVKPKFGQNQNCIYSIYMYIYSMYVMPGCAGRVACLLYIDCETLSIL